MRTVIEQKELIHARRLINRIQDNFKYNAYYCKLCGYTKEELPSFERDLQSLCNIITSIKYK